MKKDPIIEFKSALTKDTKICFLHSANEGKSILAITPVNTFSGSDMEEFKKFVKKNKGKLLIGYLSYDLAYQLHKVKRTAKNDINLPLIHFHAFDNFQIFDNEKSNTPTKPINFQKNFQLKNALQKIPESYKKAFRKIKDHILDGDIYQINLTHRIKKKTKMPPRGLFLKIIKENPVNFAAYLEGDGFEILSASPERFVKIKDQKIETCPIKGTRPRGGTPEEDKQNKNALLKSEKEEAELNMITDLLRNDLGKVCKTGSVKVEGHRLIQKCPTVWHTYSKITGEIKTDPLDALISMLPGGSITGCPKKRAIEIIDSIEPNTRGVYTGTIGYISPDQKTMDFNIAIRTLIKKGEDIFLQVGGGIVADSKLEDEFKETLDKALSFEKIISYQDPSPQ